MVTVPRPPPQPHFCCIILQPLITLPRHSAGVVEDEDDKAPDFTSAHPDFGELPVFFLVQTPPPSFPPPRSFPPPHFSAQRRAHPQVTAAVPEAAAALKLVPSYANEPPDGPYCVTACTWRDWAAVNLFSASAKAGVGGAAFCSFATGENKGMRINGELSNFSVRGTKKQPVNRNQTCF